MTRILLLSGLAAIFLIATPAAAQISMSRSPATSPVIGTVVRGNAATTFSVSTAGVVTRVSGDAIRLSSASITQPTVTLTCGTNSNCQNRDVRVTVTASGASGAGSITRFRVGSLTGATYRTAAPADAASLAFDLMPLGSRGSATFTLGMDVLLAAAANSGTDTFTFTVTATFL